MVPATLVLFAIQAGIRMGQKVYDIFVEKNFNRALSLPLGEFVNAQALQYSAMAFFEDPQHPTSPQIRHVRK